MPNIGDRLEIEDFNKRKYKPGDTVNNIKLLDIYKIWSGTHWVEKAWCVCPLCGEPFEGNYRSIVAGRTRSCGCYKKLCHLHDHTGKIYNGTCEGIKWVRTVKGSSIWLWKCLNCGETFEAYAHHVLNGDTTSCGCKKTGRKPTNHDGEIYGEYKAIEFAGYNSNGDVLYKFECLNCGAIFTAVASAVKHNDAFCPQCYISGSRPEQYIYNLLNKNNLYVEREKTFEDLRSQNKLRFDFYVNNSYIIEYDGQQHFKPVTFGNISLNQANENLQITQEHDKVKNEYCKNNNIPLIRIPYWVPLNSITIEDLCPETSQFLL